MSTSIRTKTLTRVALMAALLAVCAQIAIPSAIPFTMQTFGVFVALGLLGGRHGTLAIVLYLLLGLVGLPVFSGFTAGFGILFGTTGGYIIGFVFAGLCYWAITARFGNRALVMAVALVAGLLLCYAFGTAWFMLLYLQTTGPVGLLTVLGWCVLPFVLPDLCKLALALVLVRRLGAVLKF